MSFQRFEYPSTLPPAVQERMSAITTRASRAALASITAASTSGYFTTRRCDTSRSSRSTRECPTSSRIMSERVDGMSEASPSSWRWRPAKPSSGARAKRTGSGGQLRHASLHRCPVLAVPHRRSWRRSPGHVPGAHISRSFVRRAIVGSSSMCYRYCITVLAAPRARVLHARWPWSSSSCRFRFAEADGR